MVQVDVFWSFGIGATFAVAARHQIKREVCKWWESPYFIYNLLFAALIFVPSGLWLLWINTGWETMLMLNKNMPVYIPTIFAITNITQAILGYYLAAYFIKQDKPKGAWLMLGLGWGIFALILIVGWKRFLYAGTFEEWNGIDTAKITLQQFYESGLDGPAPWFRWGSGPAVEYPITAFFSCKIFYSLLGMGVFFVPAMVIPIWKWMKAGKELEEGGGAASRAARSAGAA